MKELLQSRLRLTFFVLILGASLQAQDHKVAFSLTGGYVQDGFGGMAALDYKINEYDYLQFSILTNFTNLELENLDVPVNLYAFNTGFYFDVLRNNLRTISISIGAGGTVGYETINKGEEVIETGESLSIGNQFVYGAYAGIDLDIFIIPTISIHIKANETYHINSDIGALSPYIGVGIKLILL